MHCLCPIILALLLCTLSSSYLLQNPFLTNPWKQNSRQILKLFSSRVATTRRPRTEGNSESSQNFPTRTSDRNLIFIGAAGGAIENIIQEYLAGNVNSNFQYNSVIFLMNRLPFSTSLLDKIPVLPLSRQRLMIATYDRASGHSQWKLVSNDANAKDVLFQSSFLGGASKGGDVIVTIEDINEYERRKFVQMQKQLKQQGKDATSPLPDFQTTLDPSDREFCNHINDLVIKSTEGIDSLQYVLLEQRSSAKSSNPLQQISKSTRGVLDQKQVKCSIIQYNELIGGIPDFQPIPFSSLPQAEPSLELSSLLQSLVVSPYNTKPSRAVVALKAKEGEKSPVAPDVCVRKTLAKFIGEYLDKELVPAVSSAAKDKTLLTPVKASLTSIEGKVLSAKDYSRLYRRLRSFTARPTVVTTSDGIQSQVTEVLSFEFKQILRLPQFMNWLEDTWYYNALLETKASTIRSGPRPTSMRIINNSTMELEWVDLNPKDMQVITTGALQFQFVVNQDSQAPGIGEVVDSEEAADEKRYRKRRPATGSRGTSKAAIPDQLVVYRIVYPTNDEYSAGQSGTSEKGDELVAETLLLERLIEGINKNAYKKMFCLPMEDDDTATS